MFWTLSHKVSVALLAILVCMMAATCSFAYWKLEDILSAMVRSRYSVVVDAIKVGIEDRNALGIPLYQQRMVQDQLERYKTDDAQITDIEVFNAEGDVLFNSDRGAIGSRVPEGWLRMVSSAATGVDADAGDDESQIVGVVIVGAFGQPTGGVVLRYPVTYLEDRMGVVINRLGVDVVELVAVFGVIAMIGAVILFRPIRRRLLAMEEGLNDVAKRQPHEAPPMPDVQDGSFEGCFHSFEWRTHDVVTHLNAAIEDVERLDRLA